MINVPLTVNVQKNVVCCLGLSSYPFCIHVSHEGGLLLNLYQKLFLVHYLLEGSS